MMAFWLAAAAMIAVALALALPMFLRPRKAPADESRRENIAAAREHLRELKNRALPKEKSEEYEAEIKTRLVEDADESISAGASISTSENAKQTPPSSADKTGVALVCAFLLPGALGLYWHLGAPSAPPSMPNLETAISGLQKHINENPDDANALALLARTLTVIGREEEAAEYFARARAAIAAAEDAAQETN